MSYYGGDGEIFSNAYGGEVAGTVVARILAGGALIILILMALISLSGLSPKVAGIDFKALSAASGIINPIALATFLVADWYLAGSFNHSAIGRIVGQN